MKQHSLLDGRRLLLLTTNELRNNRKPIIIAAATILVFWTLFSYGGAVTPALYTFILYIGGFIMTSRAFKELHDPELAYHYLTLPCSNLERFLSKWFITSIGYALGLIGLAYLYNLGHITIGFGLFRHAPNLLTAFDLSLWQSITNYMILHSIVFLGAVVFKRYCLLKSALFIGCLLLVLSYFTASISLHFIPLWTPATLQNIGTAAQTFGTAFWIVLAPFCWIVTYLRIKECEIN